jgi:hypothetical protein
VDNAAEAVAIIRDHHARWLIAQGTGGPAASGAGAQACCG